MSKVAMLTLARVSINWLVRCSLLVGLLSACGCGSKDDEAATSFALADVLTRDATCQATDQRLKWTYTYRADTRVLSESYEPRVADAGAIVGTFESGFDNRGLATYRQERQNGAVVWRHDYTYDEHGRLSGLSYPPLVIAYVNTYDAATGRLLTVATQPNELGPSPSLSTYEYVGDRLDHIINDDLADDTRDSTTYMFYDAEGLRTRVETRLATNPTAIFHRLTLAYDGDGRLTDAWNDGGAPLVGVDGTDDTHSTWSYRSGSDVRHMETDGTAIADNPVIDGTADDVTDFGDGCRAIGVLSPAIYRLPNVVREP